MLTTTAFAATFEFGGLDCLFILNNKDTCHTVSTPSCKLIAGLARDYQIKGFPEFDRIYLRVTP